MSLTMKVEIEEFTSATMGPSSTSSRDRRRPKRQRTPTTLYTDDNPSTFTTKIRKGDRVEPEFKPPKPSFYFVEDEEDDDDDDDSEQRFLQSPTKRSYRRRKPYHKDDMLETTTAEKLEAMAQQRQMAEAAAAAAAAVAPPVKRKRGRPPKNKNKPVATASTPPSVPVVSTSTTGTTGSLQLAPTLPSLARNASAPSTPGKSTRVKLTSNIKRGNDTPVTVPLNDLEGSFLNHSVRLAPILPAVVDETDSTNDSTAISSKSGPSNSKITPPESPQWSNLYSPNVYFDEDYDAEANRLPEEILPVTRSITCMTTRKPDHKYMAVGDSMGFCIIYSIETLIRPIARLETVACQQRAKEEQEKLRDQQRRKRKSLVVDASQTTIHALGMIGDRVVLATACELECMDIPSQTSLWVCPLAQDRLVTSLDMHPTRYDVLVSCSLFDNAAMLGQSSPLMLLQHSQNNVEVCDANAPILLRSPCCTAIWDNSKEVENRLLFVAVANEELELILVQGGSIDNWKVACKTRIPVKASNHFTRLSQSPDGNYTLVASSRGIRLYQTETLQLIHVYGDQLALHGKSVVWKDCLMLGTRLPSKFRLSKDASGNVECEDWLQGNDNEETEKNEGDYSSDLGQYVVGVPHSKGPKELTETLHVWRVEHASVVPAISLALPPKSDGVQALVAAPGPIGDRLVVAGRDGQGHVLQPKLRSSFAGIMYPPGYQVITDNVDYMEDEGELDQVIGSPPRSTNANQHDDEVADVDILDDEMDEDLREAMRRSLLEERFEKERRLAPKDADVDIVYPLIPEEDSSRLIPCRPEAYLRQAVNSIVDDDDEEMQGRDEDLGAATGTSPIKTPSKSAQMPVRDPKLFVSNILESLGHANPKKKEGEGDFSFSVTAKVVIAAAPSAAAVVVNRGASAGKHAKRSRAASLEALMKSSIDPRLQRFMFSKQAYASNGKGSSLPENISPALCGVELPKHVTPSPDADGTDDNGDDEDVIPHMNGVGGLAPKMGGLHAKIRQDETDVALGLLGLSPSHIRVNTPDNDGASDTASRTSYPNSKAGSDSDFVMDLRKEPKKDPNCYACRGRLLIHSCGRRALPIDFDEMAKVEREKREKEEEEKKRQRAEKRRQADQRRREARKQKQRELEEQRRREEEQVRLEKERIRRMEEANAAVATTPSSYSSVPSAVDLERQRREMIMASYASHISHGTPKPSLELNSVDYNHRTYSDETSSLAAAPVASSWERVAAATPATASREVADAVSAYTAAAANGDHRSLLPSGTTTMATLSSADALVALASFAGIKADQQEQNGQPASTSTSFGSFDRAPAPAHGFGAALVNTAKRAIPSFAALRGQSNGQDIAGAAATSRFLQRPMAPESGTTATPSTSFVWPPRSSATDRDEPSTRLMGVKWPPSSSSSS